ncbi:MULTISPECIES: hypothetical protein [Streptomyces]|uniref:Large Ala/Glu-rich protein n=1 Tax=Streptomyces flavovirens TaxID=52258 RepID=A0ABV8NBW3_9ACTN|nr:hypothetical protein [Streptomyces sp. MBT51]MBK3596159.1 hypothetical protein [Streptomyces sp. MBT51]
MATAARSKSPARRKPPARTRKTTTPKTTTAAAAATAPAEDLPGVRPEADPLVADARDRAADILDLAADRAQNLATRTRVAEQHLVQVRDQVAVVLAEQAGLAEQQDRMRTRTQIQLEAAEDTARRIDTLTTHQLAAAERAVVEHQAEAGRILAVARREAAEVADRLVTDARQQAQAFTAGAEADRRAAARERAAAEAELARAHERATALGEVADEQLAARRVQTERLHLDAVRAADRLRADATSYATAQRSAAEKAAAKIRATAEQLAARTRREAQQAADLVRAEADQVLDRARSEAARVNGEAVSEADRLRDEARRAAVAARAKGEQHAAQLVATARQEATVLKRDAALLRGIAERELAAAETDRAEAATIEETPAKPRQSFVMWLWGRAPWAALVAAIGLTASGEYKLAALAGFGIVSWLLPVCIDIWAATAFHRKKDVKAALAMMIATNVIYHMAERGIVGIRTVGGRPMLDAAGHPVAEWWLIGLVACIAPVVLWRVHQLIGHPSDTPDTTTPDAPAGAASNPGGGYPSATVSDHTGQGRRTGQDGSGRPRPDGTEHHRPDHRTGPATSADHRTATRPVSAAAVPASRVRATVTGPASGTRTAPRPAPSDGPSVLPDEDLITAIRQMPTDSDGCLPPTRVRDTLGCGRPRAIRLMRIVGVLRAEDDPELTTTS